MIWYQPVVLGSRLLQAKVKSIKREGCPGLVDYVMIWIKEPSIKNEK